MHEAKAIKNGRVVESRMYLRLPLYTKEIWDATVREVLVCEREPIT